MGNQNSRAQLLSENLKSFSDCEKADIQKLFINICGKWKSISSDQIAVYAQGKVTEDFARQVFRAACTLEKSSPDGLLDLVSFAKAMTILLKGDQEETGHFLLNMLGHTASCKNTVLQKFLQVISSQFLEVIKTSPEFKSWNFKCTDETVSRLVQMFYFNLLSKRKNVKDLWENTELVFNECELQEMFFTESLLSKAFRFISAHLFPVLENRPESLLPECVDTNPKESSALLDLPSVLLLNQSVSSQQSGSWHLLYSTSLHGHSFSMFLGHIIQKGPSFVVIKDKEGYIFGGFASQKWELKPTFTGKDDTFVYTLSPNLAIYSSTGYNSNYTYLCLHQHTLPNGLGFGGQLNNFGLWLDCELETGHSTPACSTFSSPQLSGSRQYKVDELQAWAIGPQSTESETKKKSILDADVGAKAILSMVNKVGASDAIREEDQQLEKEAAFVVHEENLK